jgi:hypothetical protein
MAADPDYIYNRGLVNESLPTAGTDEAWKGMRVGARGEQWVQPVDPQALAREGSYFVVTNPTPGTGLIGIAASTAYDAAESFLHMRNTSTTKKVHLHYMHLKCTAAGTNGTTFGATMVADRGTSRYTSGGATLTPVNVNLASSASGADVVIKAGPLVTTAASADARIIGDYPLRTVIKVIGDSYLFTFGAVAPLPFSGVPIEGTTQTALQIPCPPVVLGENDQFLFHEYGASQSVGAAYTLSLGFWLR